MVHQATKFMEDYIINTLYRTTVTKKKKLRLMFSIMNINVIFVHIIEHYETTNL